MIYKHVYENFAGYDWYLRAWDDNFIFPDAVAAIAANHNASKPMEIGLSDYGRSGNWCHDASYSRFRVTKSSLLIPCPRGFNMGGAATLLSAAALRMLGPVVHSACPREVVVQEDVTMAICMEALGIAIVRDVAFFPNNVRPWGNLPVFPSDMACRRKIVVNKAQPQGRDIASLHYVKNHSLIYQWATAPCNASVALRLEEERTYGYWNYSTPRNGYLKHVAGFTVPMVPH